MRYLIFAGDDYEAIGGWNDFVGAAPYLSDVKALFEKAEGEWLQMVDLRTLEATHFRWDVAQKFWTSDLDGLRAREAEASAKAQAKFDRTHVKLPVGVAYCGDCKIGSGCSWCSCGKYGKAEAAG